MNENKNHYPVIIIGAGAAGLMCAITAAKKGRKVLILDHTNKVGKKILMSGGGRCNFTNYTIEPENYISKNPHFCKSALSRFNQWQFIEMVEQHNIEYYDKGLGQLFCRKSSREIRDLLIEECQKHSVRIQLNTVILKVEHGAEGFDLTTKNESFSCRSLVIATGGLSIPTMGASGFGYQIAEQFGHSLVPQTPALSPLTFDKKWLIKTKQLPGNSIQATVKCGQQSFTEALLFTHKGLSGPAILQISSYWQPGKSISVNLLPQKEVLKWLVDSKHQRPEIQLKTLLATQFSQAISEFLCYELGLNEKLKHLELKSLEKIEQQLTQWVIYPSGLEGYRVAEVTLGGISTDEISSKSFESNKQKGLFFIGEVLDVTGHLGGYNFQWAWSSGYAAGCYV